MIRKLQAHITYNKCNNFHVLI